jgi:hydrogenase maturation protease
MNATAEVSVAPVLVFAWGNLSRGDDALGPMLLEHLRAALPANGPIEYLDDYQLQVEHALDLVGRKRVLFVDASVAAKAPFAVTQLKAQHDTSISTHAMSPQALMQVFEDLHGVSAPPCTLLAIRGEHFGLGDPPTAQALAYLDAALVWALAWLGVTETCTS